MAYREDRQLTPGRAAVLVGAESLLGASYALRYGAGPGRLLAGLVVAVALGALAARQLIALRNAPFFQERRAYTVAISLLLGAPLAAIGIARIGDVEVATALWAVVLGAGTLVGIVVYATSPRRGNGFLQRMTARRYGSALCPQCGMATSAKRRCSWCGHPFA